jgi:predicted nucleic acid-binding protein
MVSVALDTNILAYAEGTNGAAMKDAALGLVQQLPPASTFLPVQALGELFNVLVRKARRSPAHARAAILTWGDTFPLIETSSSVALGAADLATDHRFGIWDAVILAAAAEARCRLLLSEDLQEGFTWSGVTVTNPFVPSRHALLTALLQGDPGH